MRSTRKGPNDETGTQWPYRIQEGAGIPMVIIGRKKGGDSNVFWRRRLPEDHLRAGGFLKQTKKRNRAGDESDQVPQPKQPSTALRKVCDEQDRAEQQCAPNHPRGADRVINGASQAWRDVPQRHENRKIRVVS